jgi:hypothetical protein
MPFKTLEEANAAEPLWLKERADFTSEIERLEGDKKTILGEQVKLKKAVKDAADKNAKVISTLKEAGLEWDEEEEFTPDLVKGALEKTKTAAKQGTVPETDVQKILKKMDALEKKATAAEQAAEQEKKNNRIEKALNALTSAGSEHFSDPETVFENVRLKGIADLDETGQPGIRQGEEFILLNPQKGPNAIDALKKLYPKLAVTKQQQGGKDTSARGGQQNDDGTREMTRKELAVLPATEQMALAKSGKLVLKD